MNNIQGILTLVFTVRMKPLRLVGGGGFSFFFSGNTFYPGRGFLGHKIEKFG